MNERIRLSARTSRQVGAMLCFIVGWLGAANSVGAQQPQFQLETTFPLEASNRYDATGLRPDGGELLSATAGTLTRWDAKGDRVFSRSIYSYYKKGFLFFKRCKSKPVLSSDWIGRTEDSLYFMQRRMGLYAYGSNADYRYGAPLGKYPGYIDYIEDPRYPYEIAVWAQHESEPNGLCAPSASKAFVALRYNSWLPPKKARTGKEKFWELFDEYDPLIYRPEFRALAVFDYELPPEARTPKAKKCKGFFWGKKDHLIKPSVFVGNVDSVFLKTYEASGQYFPQGRSVAFDYDAANDRIFLGFQALHKIAALNGKGDTLAVFGTEGRYRSGRHAHRLFSFEDLDTANFKKSNAMEMYDAAHDFFSVAYYLSPVYRQIKYDSVQNLVYRTYQLPEDGLTEDSLLALKQSDEEAYWEVMRRKPTFLQVYDAADDYKLIYDAPVRRYFRMAGFDAEGALWATLGWTPDEKTLAARYRLVR